MKSSRVSLEAAEFIILFLTKNRYPTAVREDDDDDAKYAQRTIEQSSINLPLFDAVKNMHIYSLSLILTSAGSLHLSDTVNYKLNRVYTYGAARGDFFQCDRIFKKTLEEAKTI